MSQKAEVVLSLKDNFSETLRKTKALQEQFTKDLDGMQKRLDGLNRMRTEIKIDAADAKRELKQARQAYEEFNDQIHKDALTEAQARFDRLADSLRETQRQAKSVRAEMENLAGVDSKFSNRISGSSGSLSESSEGGSSLLAIAGGIMSSQLVSQLSDSVAGYFGQMITSAYGSATGNTVSSIFGGTIAGAGAGLALGSVIPGLGNAVGAAIGAVVGAISGILKDATQKAEEKDDFFRDTVKDIYDEVLGMRQDMLTAGTAIAAQRETNLTAFATLLRSEAWHEGSIDQTLDPRAVSDGGLRWMLKNEAAGHIADDPKAYAQEFLDSIVEFSRTTPFGYDELTSISKTLLAYGYESSRIIPMLTQIGNAGAALGWDDSTKVSVATYLGRMSVSDKVTMQYLNPLIAQGLDVISYIRQSLEPEMQGLTNAGVMEMISKGELSGKGVSEALLSFMGYDFEGAMDELQHSYDGLKSTLEDWDAEMQGAMGKGYNEERKAQMETQIQWYEDNADELSAMYELVGKYEADLVGEKEAAMRTSMDKLLEQAKDITDPSEMSQELYNAIVEAKTSYYDSEAYDELYNSEKNLVNQIGIDLAQTNYDCGYSLGQEFSKGYTAALWSGLSDNEQAAARGQMARAQLEKDTANWNKYFNWTWSDFFGSGRRSNAAGSHTSGSGATHGGGGRGFAYGLDYVPYDNYPATLHQGERVLTAAQARSADGTGGIGVQITGNTFIVRQESDIDAIAELLYEKLKQASATYVA